ncbi:MAG: hypothetical protein WCQ20_14510 [Synechococcaceae cyanobacterium ELA739]
MAYPSSHPAGSPSHAQGHGVSAMANGSLVSPSLSQPSYRCHLQAGPQVEGDHQLEKLEFALAVALTRGDTHRSAQLRDQIAALGGNLEEPGT